MNIAQKPIPHNRPPDPLLDWFKRVAKLQSQPQRKYYRINTRAIKELNSPLWHFYTRLVKLANFRTKQGNTTRQFEFFGGRWKRATIYENLGKLEKKGFIKPRSNGSRYFEPRSGGKTLWINKGVLDCVSSRQDALYFKFLCFILQNSQNIHKTTHRALLKAGFAANDALQFLQWIRENLTAKRLKMLIDAAQWKFKKLTQKVVYFFRGRLPWRKIGNRSATKPGHLSGPPTYIGGEPRSNGALCNAPTKPGEEPAGEPAGHRKAPPGCATKPGQTPKTGRKSTFPPGGALRIIAAGSDPGLHNRRNGALPEQREKAAFKKGEIRSILYDNLPDNVKHLFKNLKKGG